MYSEDVNDNLRAFSLKGSTQRWCPGRLQLAFNDKLEIISRLLWKRSKVSNYIPTCDSPRILFTSLFIRRLLAGCLVKNEATAEWYSKERERESGGCGQTGWSTVSLDFLRPQEAPFGGLRSHWLFLIFSAGSTLQPAGTYRWDLDLSASDSQIGSLYPSAPYLLSWAFS